VIVTLLTDYGRDDDFVGVCHGVIRGIHPEAEIVDITHGIERYAVRQGALVLRNTLPYMPIGVHVAVVDPQVGTERRALALRTGDGRTLVGPDNGLLSLAWERCDGVELAVDVTRSPHRLEPVSATFHGRDIFAPVAGALSLGVRVGDLGAEIEDFMRLPSAAPARLDDGTLAGTVIHVDRFGNCVTNVTPRDLPDEAIAGGARLLVRGHEVRTFRSFFAEDEGAGGEPFAVWGSAGLLEIAVFRDSAARVLGVRRGDRVEVRFA